VTAPLLPIAVLFGAGVWLGLLVAAPRWVPAAGGLLLALALEAVRRGQRPAASVAVLAVVGLAGWARPGLPDPWPAWTELRPGLQTLEGFVAGEPQPDGPRTRVPLLVRGIQVEGAMRPATARLLVHLYGSRPTLRPLDHVRVTVRLNEARAFRNPGTGEAGPMRVSPTPALIAVGQVTAIEPLPGAGAPWWLHTRAWVHDVVRTHLPPVSGALFEGLLLGERRQLPPTLVADFRAAGVFHVLAISGFNVGLVAGAVFLVLRLSRLPARAAAALALLALSAFAAVVGAAPSVLRATIMAGLVLTAQLLSRESTAWNSLAAAFLLLVAWEPRTLADPGLQLSFAATAAILHLGPGLRTRLGSRCPHLLATALAVSIAAQLGVTPLMLVHWNQLSLVAIVANLAVVPLAALTTTLGLLAVATAGVSEALARLEFQSLWLCLVALRAVVRGFARVPLAVVYLPAPPGTALAAGVLALILAPLTRPGRGRALVAILGALAVAAAGWALRSDGHVRFVILDVGQGDAILVRAPEGQALLVDTGGGGPGRADRGERVVVPVLRRLGVGRLTALALTHADPDHAGGLPGLVAGMPIDEVWVPDGIAATGWQELVEAAGIRVQRLVRGDRRWLGSVLVTALHPPPPARPEGAATARHGPGPDSDANNRSLVLRVEWGLAATLLMGDAEAAAEARLLAAGVPLRATVLKVGHHGSRHASSPSFLAAAAPRLAVVSVGGRNPFGHPAPAALARLDAAGARLYRTDVDGAIDVASDGARLWVRRWARPGAPEELALDAAP
jgi:competence protein ComEC